MSELDELLSRHSELVSAGAGHFTVDPRRQRELLAKLGLQNTAQGFLKLCQGIHRLRPEWVRFQPTRNSLQVFFAPQKELPDPVWDPSEPLGLALLNLSREYQVRWEFHRDGVLRAGHVAPESFRAEELDRSPHPESRSLFTISKLDAKWWHRDWTDGVRTLLTTRLCWNARIWRWNDGWFIPKPLSRTAEALVLSHADYPGELEAPPGHKGALRRLRLGSTLEEERCLGGSPSLRPAHAILAATRQSWSETFFVLDGVLLESERNLLDRPGVLAIVSADGLTPALSGLQLVHDAAFRQLLQGLRPEVSWLDEINQRT